MRSKKLATSIASLTLGIGAVIGYSVERARAAGIPAAQALTYSGVLTNASGTPLMGSKNIQISIYDMATAGTLQCSAGPTALALVSGGFQLALPDTCITAVHGTPNLWIEVFVDGTSLGRTKLGAVPFAAEADHAKAADNATNATTATTANGAGGTLATNISSLQSSVSTLLGRVNLNAFVKGGNNGSVSCDTFCSESQWGSVGTCVGANLDGAYIPCSTNLGISNASVGTCWCSAP